MKEGKLLDRVQAVSHPSINIILATVREYGIKIDPLRIDDGYISLQFHL